MKIKQNTKQVQTNDLLEAYSDLKPVIAQIELLLKDTPFPAELTSFAPKEGPSFLVIQIGAATNKAGGVSIESLYHLNKLVELFTATDRLKGKLKVVKDA